MATKTLDLNRAVSNAMLVLHLIGESGYQLRSFGYREGLRDLYVASQNQLVVGKSPDVKIVDVLNW